MRQRKALKRGVVKQKKNSAERTRAAKFAKIVCSIVGICLMLVTVAAYGYVAYTNNAFQNHLIRAEAAERAELEELAVASGINLNSIQMERTRHVESPRDLGGAPRTTFMIVGLDDVASLVDTLMVGVFNHATTEITLISIPRDTYIQLCSSVVREMQALGGFPPSSGITRINAVRNFHRADGLRFLQHEVENLMGFGIDFYFEMSLCGFRDIVDVLGGVTMDVPIRMFYNPYDQPLIIDLQPGVQHLDGAQAEGFIRFRGTPEADLFRIRNQQQFMNALITQAMTRENIINNAFEIAGVILQSVRTNFGVTDIPRYIRYVTSLNVDKIRTYSLPSERPAGSFFWHDPVQTRLLVDGIFWDGERDEDGERVFHKEDLQVAVLNGGAISGLAAARQTMLLNNGFNQVYADNFYGTRRNYTRIIAFSDVVSQIMAEYFPLAVIEGVSTQNRALIRDFDAVVVIGLDER